MDEAEALARECDVDALDIFVESVAFGNEHLARMGRIAAATGRPLRAHAEQLSTMRSVPVALEHGARSLDHLSRIHPDDIAPLAAAECAAVLLPGAELMNAEATAPARALADAGAICVLATDFNPGTSPILSMPLIIGLAVRRYGWSVREALLASTLNAAWVLGRALDPGDVLVLDGPAEHVPYRFGHNPVAVVIAGGEVAWVRPDQAWRVALVIGADELRDRLAGLEPIGLGEDGTTRLAWTPELAAAEDWFREQAAAGGLRVERDPAGSLWAVPEVAGPWWATGSHLDSVRSGGRFDGALGVAAGLRGRRARAGRRGDRVRRRGGRAVQHADVRVAGAGGAARSDGARSRRRRRGVAARCDAVVRRRSWAAGRRSGVARAAARVRRTAHRPDTGACCARCARRGRCGRSPRGCGWLCGSSGGRTTPGRRGGRSVATRSRRRRG